jgi:hypothetical protein
VVDQHDNLSKLRHFCAMVRHVDHRHTFCLEPLQVGQDFAVPRLIKGGKQLIEQKKSRLGNQRAPNRDPLLLTP